MATLTPVGAAVRVERFGFAYPDGTAVLAGVDLIVPTGAFCVVVGPTGCGKTTLLRSLKPELAPAGTAEGTVEVLGRTLIGTAAPADRETHGAAHPAEGATAMSAVASATEIGFVMQDPAAQIVCDTVWHELAFGLEGIGTPQDEMRRRIAEVAHFLGLEPLMHTSCEALSGGQQQLVNLAATLALRPRLMVLDEPCAQLDPEAQHQFLYLLARINRELNVTVVLSTHTPELTAPWATMTYEMGSPAPVGTRADVRRWRDSLPHPGTSAEAALTVRGLHVRYDRDAPWVLRNVDLTIPRGTVHVVVGGNGCGKSTLLRALAGILKPQRGRVGNPWAGAQALLPQDPKALFVCDTVADELAEWRERAGYTAADEQAVAVRFGLAELACRHPFDLSGGQQQKLALAKVLLTDPHLLLLDEPTKGLDPASAAEVVGIVRALAAEGRAVVMVTHDLDVAFAAADNVTMLFDGEVAATEPVEAFFAHNLVYRPHEESRLFGALGAGAAEGPADGRPASGREPSRRTAGKTEGSEPAAATQAVRGNAAPEGAPAAETVGAAARPRRRGGIVSEAVALISVPAVLIVATLAGVTQTALLSFAVVVAALVVFFASFEAGSPRLRELMPTVVLAALAAAGRMVFAAVPSFKPVSAIAIIAGGGPRPPQRLYDRCPGGACLQFLLWAGAVDPLADVRMGARGLGRGRSFIMRPSGLPARGARPRRGGARHRGDAGRHRRHPRLRLHLVGRLRLDPQRLDDPRLYARAHPVSGARRVRGGLAVRPHPRRCNRRLSARPLRALAAQARPHPHQVPHGRARRLERKGLVYIAGNEHVCCRVLRRGVAIDHHEGVAGKVLRQTCRGIHHQRRAAYHQKVGRGDGGDGTGKHTLRERLAVEHHVRLDGAAAGRAYRHMADVGRAVCQHPRRVIDRPAALADVAMHRPVELPHARAARGLMEPVDILRHHRGERARRLKRCELAVAAVGPSIERDHLLTIEREEVLRVRLVKLMAEHHLGRIGKRLVIQPVHAPKVWDTACRRDARTAKEHRAPVPGKQTREHLARLGRIRDVLPHIASPPLFGTRYRIR